jgi:hypothetical protein
MAKVIIHTYDNDNVHIETRTPVIENGEVVGEKIHRHSLLVGDKIPSDIGAQNWSAEQRDRIHRVSGSIWTPAKIAARRERALADAEASAAELRDVRRVPESS